ncbi:hypothetical protein QYF36_012499 [Acer negundo]|nr:hypothetical protein QYF36_012499 [Acer negundo]
MGNNEMREWKPQLEEWKGTWRLLLKLYKERKWKRKGQNVAKEAENVSFEAPLLYKKSMPYVPLIARPCHLHKSNWYRLFSKPSKPFFQVNIYLPLFVVVRNMPMRTKYFQDIISRRCKFEALEPG